MKTELNTLEVIEKLKALHTNYITLAANSKEKGALVSVAQYKYKAKAVAESIHEIELMAGLILDDAELKWLNDNAHDIDLSEGE
ncbi:hypothetical protein [Vibrio alfacsensis]|uniref:hypothetical protein n=1 Tax=Vibrio alfacsensis TaxID=1074311 RepID=UPI0040686B27